MSLLLLSQTTDMGFLREALAELAPGEPVEVWPEVADAAAVEGAVCWKPPDGALGRFPRLGFALSLGAGVDTILGDPELPPGLPVCRMVDPDMRERMTEYVLWCVLNHQRHFHRYVAQQAEGRWRRWPFRRAADTPVGLMGLGALGRDAAARLRGLGYPVRGWSRTPRRLDGVETFAGIDGLPAFLAGTQVLVCLLPLTPETDGILDAGLFAALPAGAYVVNAGRGEHLVEADLLAALDSGHLAGAALDVFPSEPLSEGHPFWRHPKVLVTPHSASITDPRAIAARALENLARVRAGEPPRDVVDRGAGY